MTTVRDAQGIPILGQTDPLAEGRARIAAILDEKRGLTTDDHDWMVVVFYHLGENDAARAHQANITGIAADPQIILANELIRGNQGPVCTKCQQDYLMADTPCPGMSFEEHLAQMPSELRQEVVARMVAARENEQDAVVDINDETGVVTVNGVVVDPEDILVVAPEDVEMNTDEA